MKKKIDAEVYFTPKQAAEYFNLSLSTIKNYIYAGKLRTLKTPGGHHRIRKSDLLVTMGDMALLSSRPDDFFNLMQASCDALLATFRLFGNAGNSLIAHCKSVSRMSYRLAKSIGMPDNEVELIKMAGLVHDIGQVAIDQSVLCKQAPLTETEYNLFKSHSKKGEEILSAIRPLNEIAGIVGQHHERPDGMGYPHGLRGNEIYKASAIISITEAYDSMVSPYSYKKAISEHEAISELLKCSGSQFDTEVVKAFVENL